LTRTYYRLSLSALCALAAGGGPVLFLEDRLRSGYVWGGLVSALLTWVALQLVIALERYVAPELQGILGAGAAYFSWAIVTLVAVFDIIPHIYHKGLARFDPVWIMGGLAPLVTLPVAAWRHKREGIGFWPAFCSALFRFSAPLWVVQRLTYVVTLPKQYHWLAVFTGMMFLVLDGLGVGEDLPFHIKPGGR